MNQFAPSLIATDAAERDRFLAALRTAGSVSAAARATGAVRTTVNRLRRRDRAFDAACRAITGDPVTGTAADALEAALLARATRGTERTRRYADGRTETWREYDNRLAMHLLAKLKPERYGDGVVAAAPPVPTMTRAEFLAAIDEMPRTVDLPQG